MTLWHSKLVLKKRILHRFIHSCNKNKDLLHSGAKKKKKKLVRLLRKRSLFINASEGRTGIATLLSMYIAHTDCREDTWPKSHGRHSQRPPKRSDMLVGVALSLTPFIPDSHLLQRVAQFDPLSLYGRFGGSSGCISVAAQITHLIREGCICRHTHTHTENVAHQEL